MSLDITIWGDMRLEFPAICSAFLPHKNRIHRLMFQKFINVRTGRRRDNSWCIPTTAEIIGSLRPLSNLREVEFGLGFEWNLLQFESLFLSPLVRITNPVDLLPSMEEMGKIEFRRIIKMVTSCHLDSLVPSLESFENLTELRLNFTSEFRPSRTPILKTAPLHLNSIYYHQRYCANLGRLFRLVSPQLTHLDLQIHYWRSEQLIENLKSLGCLNVLALRFVDWYETISLSSIACNITIATLHTMEISIGKYCGPTSKYTALFEAFKTFYPMVKRITLSGPNDILHFSDQYLESLQSLEWIEVFSGVPRRKIVIPSLRSICCNAEALTYFDAPNLLSLVAKSVEQTSQLDNLRKSNLRKLSIGIDTINLNLDGSQYPNLHEININMQNPNPRWTLSSFPRLLSFTLQEINPFGLHWTRLCLLLIYNPEICPSLRYIHLTAFVEWDILFLMLQKRNCEAREVSKIVSVNQRFVPLTLQPTLSALLEGTSVDVLGNNELRREATGEIICDPNISGCTMCLKRMRPGCAVTVENGMGPKYEVFNGISSKLEPLPPTIPTEVREWLMEHDETAEKWRALFVKFQLTHYRQADCKRPWLPY